VWVWVWIGWREGLQSRKRARGKREVEVEVFTRAETSIERGFQNPCRHAFYLKRSRPGQHRSDESGTWNLESGIWSGVWIPTVCWPWVWLGLWIYICCFRFPEYCIRNIYWHSSALASAHNQTQRGGLLRFTIDMEHMHLPRGSRGTDYLQDLLDELAARPLHKSQDICLFLLDYRPRDGEARWLAYAPFLRCSQWQPDPQILHPITTITTTWIMFSHRPHFVLYGSSW